MTPIGGYVLVRLSSPEKGLRRGRVLAVGTGTYGYDGNLKIPQVQVGWDVLLVPGNPLNNNPNALLPGEYQTANDQDQPAVLIPEQNILARDTR